MAIGLLFSGQGAQQVGMGRPLYEASAVVRDLYAQADETLGWELSKISFEGPEQELTETRVCQPALYVIGCAAHALLKEESDTPEVGVALGLSLGELTALAAASVFDFATGLRIVAERGRLMQMACEQTSGGMASIIGADQAMVVSLCSDFEVDMANVNCPGQIVISGALDRVEKAVKAARDRGAKMAVPLKVAGAYHSRLMEPARQDFEAFLSDITFKPPAIPVFSNTTGMQVSQPDEIRQALARQVVSTVLWDDCMANAAALGITKFYECGPGRILSGLARRMNKSWKIIDASDV